MRRFFNGDAPLYIIILLYAICLTLIVFYMPKISTGIDNIENPIQKGLYWVSISIAFHALLTGGSSK